MEHVVDKIKLVKTRVERVENKTELIENEMTYLWKMEKNVKLTKRMRIRTECMEILKFKFCKIKLIEGSSNIY